MTKHAIAQGLHDGTLRQVLRGVYVDSSRPEDLALRAEALALLLPPDAAVGRRSAAWLHGFDARAPGLHEVVPEAECIVAPTRQPLRTDDVRSYVAPLDGDVEILHGIPVTTVLRTAVDLLRWEQRPVALGIVDAMAHRRALDVAALRVAVEDWRGSRNVATARLLASLVDPAAESPGESWLRLRLADAGFPRPRLQVPLRRDGRVVYRLDLGFEDRRVAFEYDGAEFHTGSAQRAHDDRRRKEIEEEFGWTVVPVTRGEVLGRTMDLERCAGELLGLEPQLWRRLW